MRQGGRMRNYEILVTRHSFLPGLVSFQVIYLLFFFFFILSVMEKSMSCKLSDLIGLKLS